MNTSFSRVIIGALAATLPATALAAEPEVSVTAKPSPAAVVAPAETLSRPVIGTGQDADAMAQHYRELARSYRALGGVGFKTGLVRRAEADAAKYEALAVELRAPELAAEPSSPEAERYARLAERYRRLGGVAYKAGLVQWAEAQQRKYEPMEEVGAASTQDPIHSCHASKPVVCAQLGVR